MGSIKQVLITGAVGLSVCCIVFVGCRVAAPFSPATDIRPLRALSTAPAPRSASEVALRRAEQYRTRVKIAVDRERDGWEAWDPQGSGAMNSEEWRLKRLAADPSGDLHRAQAWAREASKQAQTPGEAVRAAELQVLLDHELGEHAAEFHEAQRLLRLAPDSERARQVFKRAAACYCRQAREGTRNEE